MHAIRIAVVAFLVLIVCGVLGLWWAGFAPFPTEPVLLAGYNSGDTCSVQEDNWAKCYPDDIHRSTRGFMSDFRAFPDAAKKKEYGPYDSWGVEGWNGCWDENCRDIWQGTDHYTNTLSWKIYETIEVPHFGLGRPKWVVELVPLDMKSGIWPDAAYTTYAACMYKKKEITDNSGFSECKPIDPEEPWIVGAIKDPMGNVK